MHPVANVGISTVIAQALGTILFWLASLVSSKPVPDTVQIATVTLLAITFGYFIHTTTGPDAPPVMSYFRRSRIHVNEIRPQADQEEPETPVSSSVHKNPDPNAAPAFRKLVQ